jgi:hypothetical protein
MDLRLMEAKLPNRQKIAAARTSARTRQALIRKILKLAIPKRVSA